MKSYPTIFAISMALVVTSCATQPMLSDQAVMASYPAVSDLKSELAAADMAGVEMLSPNEYTAASASYEEALKLARVDDAESDTVAREGLMNINKANMNADVARDVFEDVLVARDKAVTAGAKQYTPERFDSADKALLKLTTLLEGGDSDKAKAGRSDVVGMYKALELTALKGNTLDKAKEALLRAKKDDVDNFAPKTVKMAEEELALASNTLDADRASGEKADIHAQAALFHIQRASEITEVIKRFESSDFTSEDIVLWYQGELSDAVMPVYPNLPFNQENKVVIKGINQRLSAMAVDYKTLESEKNIEIATLKRQNNSLTATAKANTAKLALDKNSEINSLKQTNAALVSSTKATADKDKAVAARFTKIQTLFSDQEADVSRKADNVLINAQGFQFASGKSEIESGNFLMMDKIISSIKEFPNSTIVVTGHTDSTGDNSSNKKLSEDRAKKVALFLTDVGGITSQRISSVGYGEERPVATNDTTAGRASNRRIEVLIDNTAGL